MYFCEVVLSINAAVEKQLKFCTYLGSWCFSLLTISSGVTTVWTRLYSPLTSYVKGRSSIFFL